MSNTTELDQLELTIAESLPDHPTLAQILGAIHRGIRGGFSIGVLASTRHQAHVTDLVNRAMWEPRDGRG